MMAALNKLKLHQLRGIFRDMNLDEAEQRWKNNKRCKQRMRNWLYDRELDSVTGNPKTGRRRKYVA